jgi:Icc-related predicted phosphoesterase
MKYLIISDLHLDFWENDKQNPFCGIEDQILDLDLLIIAGDLTNKGHKHWTRMITDLSAIMPKAAIKILPGNHDFYGGKIDEENKLSDAATSAGAEYVNGKSFVHSGIRFICATLWTDLELNGGRIHNETAIPRIMNDYRYIRSASGGYRRMMAKDTLALHHKHLTFIKTEFAKPYDGETIVVTHHAPHPEALGVSSGGDYMAAYGSDLSSTMADLNIMKWCYGHSHDGSGLTVAGCDLLNVSLGYPKQVPDPAAKILNLIVTVP